MFLAQAPDHLTRAQLLANDPWWLTLIKAVVILLIGPILTILLIVWERKAVGRMQNRPGPNRVGPNGYLQSLADAIKLPFKEQIIPDTADRKVYFLAPVICVVPSLIALSAIPFGPEVSIFGHRTVLQLMELPVGVLVILACSSIGVYGLVLAGWASGSPYPLLGGIRSAAQVISYEIAMGLSIVAVILYSGSMATGDIVNAQAHGWYFYILPVSFVIYAISMVGETNRAPFDLPEAESELVGGFHTEYSSMKFAMFFLAEYVNMVIVSSFAVTLFLGGYLFPFVGADHALNQGWLPLVWFGIKLFTLLFGFIWLRGTLPRLRYDQFMQLGWKVLVPLNLVWILAVTAIRAVNRNGGWTTTAIVVAIFVAVAFVVILSMLMPTGVKQEDDYVPITGGGFPLPPLDLEIPTETPRQKAAAKALKKAARRKPAEVSAQPPAEVSTGVTGAEANDGVS